ncbi:MAG: TonB-dependent receptor [Bacteroidota bacterium]
MMRSILATALCCTCATLALAGTTGKISGVVRDARTNEPLPGVNVVIDGTTLGASTDIEGNYVILNVPPGRYRVIASFIGYRRFEVNDLRVSVDFTTPLNINLVEGSVELEAIVVQAERTPLIRQDLTNPVASISSENIEALPVTEISEVIGLQAGITVDDDGSIHIRGGLGNEIAYTLNGVNINNPYGNTRLVGVATNAIQEVSVSSGTFNAEYGSALSGVVNYVTRSGGPSWSGSFKYLGGDRLSSNDEIFFGIKRYRPGTVTRYEFTLGGPLVADDITVFASGVYNWNGGYLYGERLYAPEDSYLSREGFPSGDPRIGASSAPYYFGPVRHDTTDLVGLPAGEEARLAGHGAYDVVALNWSRGWNLLGNISWRLQPEMKLKAEILYNFDESPDGSAAYSSARESRYKPDGRAISTSKGYFYSVEFTHTVSSNMFYTFKGSYIHDKDQSWAYDDPNDPRYLPSFYLRYLPNTDFLTGGVDPSRFWRTTKTWAGKLDLVSQLFTNHEVKAGIEVRSHKLSVESYTLQFVDPNDPTATPSFSNALLNGNVFRPTIPTPEGGYTYYVRKPFSMAAYVQDKIELFRSIILNAGLRYEYFDASANYNPDISSDLTLQDTLFLVRKNVEASVKHMVSPRISVSYPITDQGAVRFSYGHFYQIGSLSSLYRNPFFRAAPGTTPSFGNPNVEPQKSIQYELGLQQGLTEDLKVELTAYYKDVSNYIYTQNVRTARGDRSYNLLTNLSYANTRGVSISLLKRRSRDDLLGLTLDYTFQVAEGNRTQPEDEIFYSEQSGRITETYLVPQGFDRSHTITGTAVLGEPSDWTVSLIGYVRTGTPYTPQFPSYVVPITFVQNSDRQVMQSNVDLKAEKFFRLGLFDVSVFVQVDNLFDAENELYVYANSGRALFNIDQVTNPAAFNDIRRRIARGDPGMIPASAIDSYYANPGNISAPRLVRLGASVTF